MTQGFLTATPFVLLFLLGFGEKAFSHLKKFILHGKSAFIENNVPNKQTKGDCGKERISKQCNRCKKYLVLITSAGIMTMAQIFSYMIQIPCYSCQNNV